MPSASTSINTVIAYEPVWAIGTGRTPTANEVQDVHAAIRSNILEKLGQGVADGMRIIYGGSMKPSNAQELLALADVDGGLIGGASLKAQDFIGIANAVP
jgi:triosephosphate isomerase